MPQLATRFSRNTNVLRRSSPLGEEQMRLAAPSIFAAGKHVSRSERYAYIPTIEVLRGLRKEGFAPVMVAQSRSRVAGKTEFTKHLIRMRHAAQANSKCWTTGNHKSPSGSLSQPIQAWLKPRNQPPNAFANT